MNKKFICVETTSVPGQKPAIRTVLGKPADRQDFSSLIGDNISLFHQYGLPDYAGGMSGKYTRWWLHDNAREDELYDRPGHNPYMEFYGTSVTLWASPDKDSEAPAPNEPYIRYDVLEVPESVASDAEAVEWATNTIKDLLFPDSARKRYQLLESWHNGSDNAVDELYAESPHRDNLEEILVALHKRFLHNGLGKEFPKGTPFFHIEDDGTHRYWLGGPEETLPEYHRTFRIIETTNSQTQKK